MKNLNLSTRGRVRAAVVEALESRQLLSTYYVSPSGNNSNTGLSPDQAWRNLQKVNSTSFSPGDTILLQGGSTFSGTLSFGADDAGAAGAPVRVGSYGTGRATISSGNSQGLRIQNAGYFEISDLNIVGAGRTVNLVDGLTVWQDSGSQSRLPHIYIDDVEVRGYGKHGIVVGAALGNAGFSDVRVTDSVVRDNAIAGLYIWGDSVGRNEDVYIARVRAFNNAGIAGATYHSGNGIIVEATRRAVIERCVAFNNGLEGKGGIGIWSHTSDRVVIQYNESYANRTAGNTDGGGFALDGGSTNSVMQYNYSHDNDGAGYGLYQFFGASAWSNNVVRYNISQNDGRKNSYGAVTMWNGNGSNGLNGAHIHNNTFYLSPAANGSPPILRFMTGGTVNFSFRNNIFTTSGGAHFTITSSSQSNLKIQGNNYFTSGAGFVAAWNGVTYHSYAAWQSASGQEILNGAHVGKTLNPGVTSPFGGGTIGNADNLSSLTAYKLTTGSAMIDAGLDLQALFGTQMVPDFWGTATPQGPRLDIGAHEFPGGGGGGGGDAYEESGGRVEFEAEGSTGSASGSGSAAGHAWNSYSDGQASNGTALVANPNSNVNTGDVLNGPRRDYAIDFSTTGTYYVWVRMSGPTGSDDSLHVGLNGSAVSTPGGVSLTTSQRGVGWVWTNAGPGGARLTINVASAGIKTFNLWMREDGTRVDRFILTRDANFNPGNPGGGGINESGGRVDFEAEASTGSAPGSGSAASHTWSSFSDGSAGGGTALVSSPNSGVNVGDTTSGPRRDYAINFGTTGTYYVWVRMSGPSGSDDSLHVGMNGTPTSFGAQGIALATAERGNGWFWKTTRSDGVRVTVNVASAGTRTFNLWMREDGTRVDQFILTRDAGFDPSGGNGGDDGGGGISESNGRADFEAEASTGSAGGTGEAAGHAWVNQSDASASGGTALLAGPNSGLNVGDSTSGPRRDYAITFTTTGTYYLWVRMSGQTGSDDSLHIGLNGALLTAGGGVSLTTSQRGAGWVWTNAAPGGARLTVNISTAGTHTLNLWMREDGTMVDALTLTTDAAFMPG